LALGLVFALLFFIWLELSRLCGACSSAISFKASKFCGFWLCTGSKMLERMVFDEIRPWQSWM